MQGIGKEAAVDSNREEKEVIQSNNINSQGVKELSFLRRKGKKMFGKMEKETANTQFLTWEINTYRSTLKIASGKAGIVARQVGQEVTEMRTLREQPEA